jgi:hypothetical protein
LRFNSPDSAYLTRGFSSGNRKTFTWSAWIKKTTLDVNNTIYSAETNTSNQFWIAFGSANTLVVFDYQGAYNLSLTSTPLYRDVSAWYHIVVAVDTTQATSTNRAKVYVNGLEITVTGTYPTQNYDTMVNNSASTAALGRSTGDGRYLNSYMTEVNFIDGQALTPSSFGETNAQTGIWQPKAYSGSYGTNGFYLNFSDNSNTTAATLGKDYSGNGNNWTPNNFSVTAGAGNDSLVDVPTPYGVDTGVGGTVRGNYCTFNPLFRLGGTTALTWALNGNLQAKADSNASMIVYGTMGLDPSTKFYNEFTMTNTVEGGDHVGIVTDIQAAADGGTCVAYRADGQKIVNGTVSAYGASYTDNDIIGVAVNLVDNQVTFYKNGTSQGTITGVTSATYFHRVRFNNVAGQQTEVTGNWGQRAFAYTAPSGFKALCTQNLPTPTIGATTATQASKYFNAVTYTGTGSSLGVTGVGFQPDWVWVKGRSAATDHALYDAVRGVQKQLESNTTDSETTETNGLTAFGSDGFTVGSLAQMNTSVATYVAWNWKANGAGSTNTQGTITSTVSASTASGFSVLTYQSTGTNNATIGHGLGTTPTFAIVIKRNAAHHPRIGTSVTASASSPTTGYLTLTAAFDPGSGLFNAFNSTTITVGTSGDINSNAGDNYVMYCFAPVAGYSAIGSYIGNGSADGPFIFTGFRPRWLLTKRTDSSTSGDWNLVDTSRGTYNAVGPYFYANSSNAEASAAIYDILSNGFKIRETGAGTNASGSPYFYMAFAENPFKYSLAR